MALFKDKIYSLIRVALANFAASLIVFALLIIYNQISLKYAVISISFMAIFNIIFFWPYICDLYNLIDYVKKLAKDNRTKPPTLNQVRIEHLSKAIDELNILWIKKQYELEAKILENSILFDNLPDAVIMLDQDIKIVRININGIRLFGKQTRGKTFKEIVSNDIVHDYINLMMHDKKSKSFEVFIDKLEKHYMFRIAKFPSNSIDFISSIIVMTDITESKRTEQMFVDFVANASHEIRTPLSSIKGFVEILQTTAKDDPDCHDKFLTIIATQAERLNLLVSDLLSLSKLEFDSKSINHSEVDICNVIKIAYDDLLHIQQERNIIFEISYISPNIKIMANEHEILQVFTNLFSNAIKYSYKDSIVKVTMNIFNEAIDGEDYKWLVIAIIDKSEGIDKQHIERLTERFYRIDSARTRSDNIGGTGIGLSIVKQILIRHNGKLEIESVMGEGSIFSVYLRV